MVAQRIASQSNVIRGRKADVVFELFNLPHKVFSVVFNYMSKFLIKVGMW